MRKYAVVDIETSGGHVMTTRITEVSVLVFDGEKIIDEFTSLVNPECDIPPFITRLTGISNQTVEDAPVFEDIAENLVRILQGTTFVAHNVNFDYSIIQNELANVGYNFSMSKLCTVKLSRSHLPGLSSYGLGNLCERFGIPINGRHRARGDAEATVKLLALILEKCNGNLHLPKSVIEHIPAKLPATDIVNLPEGPGLLHLYDSNKNLLAAEHSKNLLQTFIKLVQDRRKRAVAFFYNDIAHVEFEETKTFIEAKIRAGSIQAEHRPMHMLRNRPVCWTINESPNIFGFAELSLVRSSTVFWNDLQFESKKSAVSFIFRKMVRYKIDPLYLLEKPGKILFDTKNYPSHACRSADEHVKKLSAAFDHIFDEKDFLIEIPTAIPNVTFGLVVQDYTYRGFTFIDSADNGQAAVELSGSVISDPNAAMNATILYDFLLNTKEYRKTSLNEGKAVRKKVI